MDVCYAIYYPLTEKYVSLYPRKGGIDQDQEHDTHEVTTKKPNMWNIVKKSMAEGSLDNLREGKSNQRIDTEAGNRKSKTKAAKQKHHGQTNVGRSQSATIREVEEESDGGFFE